MFDPEFRLFSGGNDDEPGSIHGAFCTYPLVMTNSLLLKMAIYSGFSH